MFHKAFLAIYVLLAVIALYGVFSGSTPFFNLLVLVGLGLIYVMIQRSTLVISIIDLLTKPKDRVDLPDYLGRGYNAELKSFSLQIEKIKNLQIIEWFSAVLKPMINKTLVSVKQSIFNMMNLNWLKYSAMAVAAIFVGYLGINTINQMNSAVMALVVSDKAILSYIQDQTIFKDIKPYIIPLTALIAVIFLYFGFRLNLIFVRFVSLVFLASSIVGLFLVPSDGFFMTQVFNYQISWIMMPVGLLTLVAAAMYAKFMNVTYKVERKLCVPSGLAWAGVLLFLPLGALELADHSTVYPILVFISIYVFISDLLGRYLRFSTLRLPILGLIVPLSLSIVFYYMSYIHGDYNFWSIPAIGIAFVVQYYMLFTRPAYLMRFMHMLTAVLLIVFLFMIREKYFNNITIAESIGFSSVVLLLFCLLHSVLKKIAENLVIIYDRYVIPMFLFALFSSLYIIMPTLDKIGWLYLITIFAMGFFVVIADLPSDLRKTMAILTGATLMLWLTVAIVIWLQVYYYIAGRFIQALLNPKILAWVVPGWILFLVGSIAALKFSSRR